jgi:hypothetical protein
MEKKRRRRRRRIGSNWPIELSEINKKRDTKKETKNKNNT